MLYAFLYTDTDVVLLFTVSLHLGIRFVHVVFSQLLHLLSFVLVVIVCVSEAVFAEQHPVTHIPSFLETNLHSLAVQQGGASYRVGATRLYYCKTSTFLKTGWDGEDENSPPAPKTLCTVAWFSIAITRQHIIIHAPRYSI